MTRDIQIILTTRDSQLPQGTGSYRIRYPGLGLNFGSGAGIRRDPLKMSSDGEGFMEAYSSAGRPTGFSEETLSLSMTARQPPSRDGKASWLRYKELVDGWTTFTTIEASKRGPLLKSRLMGEAYMYKEVLDNELLQDSTKGVNQLKSR